MLTDAGSTELRSGSRGSFSLSAPTSLHGCITSCSVRIVATSADIGQHNMATGQYDHWYTAVDGGALLHLPHCNYYHRSWLYTATVEGLMPSPLHSTGLPANQSCVRCCSTDPPQDDGMWRDSPTIKVNEHLWGRCSPAAWSILDKDATCQSAETVSHHRLCGWNLIVAAVWWDGGEKRWYTGPVTQIEDKMPLLGVGQQRSRTNGEGRGSKHENGKAMNQKFEYVETWRANVVCGVHRVVLLAY